MREIKFRAWEKPITKLGFGRMYCPAFPTWNGDIEVWKNNSPQTETELLSPMCGNEPILMQYTGLRDKNGKEIYEGDIVRFTNPIDEIDQQIGVCKFEQDECNFVLQYKGYHHDHYALHTVYLISNVTYECSYEVIGNIYENPELLEGK